MEKIFRRRRDTAAIRHPIAALDDDFPADGELNIDRVPDALEFSFFAWRRRFINSITVIDPAPDLAGLTLLAVHEGNEVFDRPAEISAIVHRRRGHFRQVRKANGLPRRRVALRVEKNKGRAHGGLFFAERNGEMLAHHADNTFRSAPIANGSWPVGAVVNGGIVGQGAGGDEKKKEPFHSR